MAQKRMTDQQIKFAINEYKLGSSALKIGDAIGFSETSVIKKLKKNGIVIRKKNKTRSMDEIMEMAALYQTGASLHEVGRKFGSGANRVHGWFKLHGIAIRTPEEAHRIYEINEDFFDSIDSEEKAYFLGFLFADGCNQIAHNYSITLGLNEIDREILFKLSNFIYKDKVVAFDQVRTYDRRHEGKGVEARLTINSKHICGRLVQLGCISRKTLLLKYPKLNDNLHRHFIRGYFDGDGTINKETEKVSGCKIASTKEFLEGIKKRLHFNSNLYKDDNTTDTNTWALYFNGNRNIQKFLNWIYDGSSIYLKRKHDKFISFSRKMDEIDAKMLAGTRGYPLSYLKKNYPDISTPLVINDIELTADAIRGMSIEERECMANDTFDYLRSIGFHFTVDKERIKNEFDKLKSFKQDTNINTIVKSQNYLCDILCKYYCPDYYKTSFHNKASIYSAFMNDELLMKCIRNRFVLNWNTEERFTISFANILRGFNSSAICYNISIFKPVVAKFIYEKYSNENDTVYDYSAGWGGRMLGAISCNRNYIGVDPLTISSLTTMKNDLKLDNVRLIDGMSEEVMLDENSVDFSFSSPPYFNTEIYSTLESQAYTKGEDYFYNVYWRKTIENIKHAVKPGRWIGINVSKKYIRMINIASEYFGDVVEKIQFNMPKSHLHNNNDKDNYEYVYMFKNNKEINK